MTGRQLGPILGATLVTANFEQTSNAYCQQLGFTVSYQGKVSAELAAFWQAPVLSGNRLQILAAANGDPWLRLVEDPNASDSQPLQRLGWLALESSVASVDAVRAVIDTGQFQVLGEPAYLQVSDAIKALQLLGPAGEVSYLTEVQRPVPPFELPQTQSFSASIFIPVLAVPDRQAAVTFYQQLHNADPALLFDTKITVLNKRWQKPLTQQYPVATLQLDCLCLFEIDELPEGLPLCRPTNSLPSGIALVSCICKDLERVAMLTGATIQQFHDPYYPTDRFILLTGPAGELLELVQG